MSSSPGGTVPATSSDSNSDPLKPAVSQTTCLAGPPTFSRAMTRTIFITLPIANCELPIADCRLPVSQQTVGFHAPRAVVNSYLVEAGLDPLPIGNWQSA